MIVGEARETLGPTDLYGNYEVCGGTPANFTRDACAPRNMETGPPSRCFGVTGRMPVLRCSDEDLQRFGSGMGGEFDGLGGLLQGKAVGDEAANVQLPGKNQPGNFALEGEIRRITAEQVFFIDADPG
jgi:hypothetical protein